MSSPIHLQLKQIPAVQFGREPDIGLDLPIGLRLMSSGARHPPQFLFVYYCHQNDA